MTASSSIMELRPGFHAHASGALWLPKAEALLVADAHLGYGWAQRRRGELGPVSDGGVRSRLVELVEMFQPKALVLLGDTVHAPGPGDAERQLVEETMADLTARTQVVAVRGNHDRGLLQDFPALTPCIAEAWETEAVLAVHGDCVPKAGGRFVILGHLHPAMNISDAAGASQRVPVFLRSERALVLPAFSPFAAGWNIRRELPAEWRPLFGSGAVEAFAATGRRIASLGMVEKLRFGGIRSAAGRKR